ncbi:ATP-binding protein [Sinorhizobium meliloti]|uniref:ATP-binding protein n=1 Tax=Rhizobium meliloti TaxID=382 RepID=UPI000FDC42A1|nr:ATP-binding protein [Sinorhizobium meliloti]RVG77428.1 ATP-binding protein [Sinorhizobium meliloti]RVI30995.1 ATP-binding protein [Sinorhizobium meliloti]RVI39146.1 ATP-binding protein [Sinorhizobium meliloti]RVJ18129.1 ATP-binding protein [Sinorhizobium meliloti]RVJ87239.1 ATP-binding protein [Sinorhizobium meliloti]
MKFLILRVLTHSELGMFHEYRRQGKEGSKQRAINFDSSVVDRVFPTALDTDRIPLELRYETDSGIAVKPQWLARQAKNWRFEGNCPRDKIYDFVEPGCLFAMEVDAGATPATGAWAVFPADDEVTTGVLSDGATAELTRAGMIALHGEEGSRVQCLLNEARPEMFGRDRETVEPMNNAGGSVAGRKRLPPRPKRLAEIIARTGHTLPSAVADLVDNSISADATEIDIVFEPPNGGNGRWLTLRDNGHGMSGRELDEAMTLGSDVEYETNSLGKFGFGLKGASWSQARIFTVVTRRRGGSISHLSWDIEKLGDWEPSDAPLEEWEREATTLGEQGTVVLWRDMTPPAAAPPVQGVSPYSSEVMELERHLGLIFHRFLEGDAKNRKKVTIRINGVEVRPNNPVGHPLAGPYDLKSIRMPTSSGDETITVQPFVLPSEDQIKQHHKAEGPQIVNEVLQHVGLYGKRNESQGLFIYRNDRLIKWGGWHQMWSTSDEKTKLARVIVSFFGTKLDDAFHINITKRSVSLPSFIQDEIKKLAIPARNASKAKYKKETTPPLAARQMGAQFVPASIPAQRPSTSGLPLATQSGAFLARPASSPPTVTAAPIISYRPVTTDRFAWKVAQNLTGGRDLQVSDRLPALAALAKRLANDPDATGELAAFLAVLDEKGVQAILLDSSER